MKMQSEELRKATLQQKVQLDLALSEHKMMIEQLKAQLKGQLVAANDFRDAKLKDRERLADKGYLLKDLPDPEVERPMLPSEQITQPETQPQQIM